ncbi:30S ribosomal protein S20, partial [[Eubacterium] siraeum]|nr:30S ribosomal protein S20 [[Eubacterium] siraeum]
MPNIKSAKKRVLVSSTKQARNKADKTALKTILKKVDADTNADNFKVAVKAVDKAAAKGIIHKNAAARKKSQLDKKLND